MLALIFLVCATLEHVKELTRNRLYKSVILLKREPRDQFTVMVKEPLPDFEELAVAKLVDELKIFKKHEEAPYMLDVLDSVPTEKGDMILFEPCEGVFEMRNDKDLTMMLVHLLDTLSLLHSNGHYLEQIKLEHIGNCHNIFKIIDLTDLKPIGNDKQSKLGQLTNLSDLAKHAWLLGGWKTSLPELSDLDKPRTLRESLHNFIVRLNGSFRTAGAALQAIMAIDEQFGHNSRSFHRLGIK